MRARSADVEATRTSFVARADKLRHRLRAVRHRKPTAQAVRKQGGSSGERPAGVRMVREPVAERRDDTKTILLSGSAGCSLRTMPRLTPRAEAPIFCPMPQKPKDYVRKHLEERGVDPNTLSGDMIKALNAFSEEEYETKVIDQLGAALMSDPLPTHQKISAVH
jgi:hypothetical protein